MPVYPLGYRRYLASGELAYRVAGHHRDLAFQPAIVDPPVGDHRPADLATAALLRATADSSLYVRASERVSKESLGQTEVRQVGVGLTEGFVTDLSGKAQGHLWSLRLALPVRRLGIGQQRAGGLNLGGEIRQALRLDLMLVDAFAFVGHPVAVVQGLVSDFLQRVHDGGGLL